MLHRKGRDFVPLAGRRGPSGKPLKSIVASSSSKLTGNTTGDIWSRNTLAKLRSSDSEPQIVK